VTTVPDVRKAERWNSPFYSVEGQGWFLTYHCSTRYVKVRFFDGAALEPPLPPVGSKEPDARYVPYTRARTQTWRSWPTGSRRPP